MKKREGTLILAIAVILLIIINYAFLDQGLEDIFSNYEYAEVIRAVDGDTIELKNKEDVRLLGINSPERGERYYSEAKEFLSGHVSNKTVGLEIGREKYDQYKRILAYVFIEDTNLNIEAVRNGYANVYLLGDRRYQRELYDAWNECIAKNVGICEKSKDTCAGCIRLKEFDYTNEKTVFYNQCGHDCSLAGWTIKDEGRKEFDFENFILNTGEEVSVLVGEGTNTGNTLFWKGEEYVWTETGDTLFLRDIEEKLVLWERY